MEELKKYFTEFDKYILNIPNEINYYGILLNEYYANLYNENFGLTKEDYLSINNHIKTLYKIRQTFTYINNKDAIKKVIEYMNNIEENKYQSINAFIKEIDYLYISFIELKELLKEHLFPRTITDVILEEASLTHLVYTNNTYPEVRPYSEDSFMFLCQFHSERTPSMGVMNHSNFGRCYGCGKEFNVLNYIITYEQLTYKEAINLLAKVYLIDLPEGNIYKDNDSLVIKYHEMLLNPSFKDLLTKGFNRTSKKENTLKIQYELKKYQHNFDTIDRVKNDEHLNCNIRTAPKTNSLILKR